MDEAERLATHDRLVAELEQQVKGWRLIQDLRHYCDALEARIEDADDDETVAEAQRWLIWAREYAEMMDPLFELPVTPMPKLRLEELTALCKSPQGYSPKFPS